MKLVKFRSVVRFSISCLVLQSCSSSITRVSGSVPLNWKRIRLKALGAITDQHTTCLQEAKICNPYRSETLVSCIPKRVSVIVSICKKRHSLQRCLGSSYRCRKRSTRSIMIIPVLRSHLYRTIMHATAAIASGFTVLIYCFKKRLPATPIPTIEKA